MSELNLQAEVNRPYRESGNILKVGLFENKKDAHHKKSEKKILRHFLDLIWFRWFLGLGENYCVRTQFSGRSKPSLSRIRKYLKSGAIRTVADKLRCRESACS